MKRKKLIPLLLFLLLLLLILCVWCHSEDIVRNKATGSSHLSSIATNTVVKKDIDFNFKKEENHLELTGNFSTDKSVQILHSAIGNTEFNDLSKIDEELLAKEGVVTLTQKLLLPFTEHFQNGSISYANEKLTVEGVVDNIDYKNDISALLENSSINSQNNIEVVNAGPSAEEKAKLEAEAKAAEEKDKLEAEGQAKAAEEKIKAIITHENINFKVNKAILTPASITTVEHISAILSKYPTINVEISGHTDNTGNADYNLVLSQKRVDSVKAKLIELKIDNNRLKAIGYGANQPLVSNDTKENRHKNRRVEFKVIGE